MGCPYFMQKVTKSNSLGTTYYYMWISKKKVTQFFFFSWLSHSAIVGHQESFGKFQKSSEGVALSGSSMFWLLCPFYRRDHWGSKSQSKKGAKLTHEPKSVRIPESTLWLTVGQSLQVQWVTVNLLPLLRLLIVFHMSASNSSLLIYAVEME